MKFIIKKILNEQINSKMTQLVQNAVDEIGVANTLKFFGGYEEIKDYFIHTKISKKNKIDFILYVVGETGGIGLVEIDEDSIFYDENDEELKLIEYLGTSGVIVDVYGGYKKQHPLGDFFVHYEALPEKLLNKIFYIFLEVANNNDLL